MNCDPLHPRGKPGRRGTPVHPLGAGRAETAERRVKELEALLERRSAAERRVAELEAQARTLRLHLEEASTNLADFSEARDELTARVAELEAALRALLDKLDVIFADPGYQTVWTMANLHGVHYTGPDCRVEIEAARKLVPQ